MADWPVNGLGRYEARLKIIEPLTMYEEYVVSPTSKIGMICPINLSAIPEDIAVPIVAAGLFVLQGDGFDAQNSKRL